MSDNENQNVPLDVLQARHEAEQKNISNDDAMHLAGLFKTVGNELFSIDHKYVGGNSNTKALQLDQNKVFNTPVQQAPVQQAPVQQAPVQQAPVQQAPVQQAPVQQAPVQQAPVQQPDGIHPQNVTVQPGHETNEELVVNSNEFELRLCKLEKKFEKIIKLPHKKFNVKFKSSCLSGEFQEFDDLVDAIRKSLNKSSKRITITLNDN
jgi:hypothetical protein